MKKVLCAICLSMMVLSAVFAAEGNLSVPLSSDAYRILRVAENRGLITTPSEVKPYSVNTVRTLLSKVKNSGKISESEVSTIDEILYELDRTYGGNPAKDIKEFLNTGYLGYSTEDAKFTAGGKLFTSQTVGSNKAFDSRFKATAYIAGDIGSSISYYMDFGLAFNKLDHNAFLITDFTHSCEGWYQSLSEGGAGDSGSPFKKYYSGYEMRPDLGVTAFGGALTARFAAVEREWGPGHNNFALSGSARTFDGIEFTYSPASWFSLSFLSGSLGKGFLHFQGAEAPVPSEMYHDDNLGNNFSLQRVEVSPLKGFKAAIYETVIWRKRAELAYWNPLCVYMFAQNYIGDYDNVMAGIDFSYTFSNVAKIYGAISVDEVNTVNPKTFFIATRNILGLQAGANIPIPMGNFSELTLQTTYVPPFFGTHYSYRAEENPWGTTDFSTAYVNKGQPLTYPLYPDSLEVLMNFETTVTPDLSLTFVVKDQMRSAQFANDENYGTTYNTLINYYQFDKNENGYVTKKDFFHYIWNNSLDIEVKAKKSFKDFPITLTAGLQCIVDSSRSYMLDSTVTNYQNYEWVECSGVKYNFGNATTMGNDWKTSARFIASFGATLYY